MMCDLLSVIVPVYNIENYIEKCIYSILNQTYKNLDIILVDDGSTDTSGIVCDNLAKKDHRIRVIHKQNGGLSDARNKGLDVAKGEYISFIDGDDYIEPDMYFDMMTSMREQQCDISVCEILKTEPTRTIITKPYPYGDTEYTILNKEKVIIDLLQDKIDVSACNKVYKREVINDTRFPYGKTNEDFPFMSRVLTKTNKVIVINKAYYNYIQRENSITTTAFNIKQFDKYYNCLDVCDFIENNSPNVAIEAKHYLWYQTFCLLKKVYIDGLEHTYFEVVKEMRKTMKKNSLNIMISDNLTIKEKGMYFMISYVPKLYKLKHNINR